MSRYVVVDFAGHGFQMDLSRALARRGHEVVHTWCSSNLTPHGDLSSGAGVEAVPVSSGSRFEKYALVGRLRSELAYGLRTAALVWRRRPDAVLTSNVPLVSLACIAVVARLRRARWVLWLQDVQTGLAAQSLAGAASAVARCLGWLERTLIRRADDVVVIGDDFVPEVRAAGAEPVVIPNWAVLADLDVGERDNSWADSHGLDPDRFRFLYAGTLGRKHPPELVVAVAEAVPDAQVVVVSEGEGAEALDALVSDRGIENVVRLPFQPHAVLGEVLASADVLVAVLADEAGAFSVPSKVLSYLCAGRALLVAMPPGNGASRLVVDAAAGVAVPPEVGAVAAAACDLRHDPAVSDGYGRAARNHAEASFDVDRKAEQFDVLLSGNAHGGTAA